jgi:hypothetical protein
MNRLWRIASIACLAITIFSGCVKKEVPQPVFLTDPPDFKPGLKGGADWVYIKEGVDFKPYNKIMIGPIEFYLKKNADYKGINAEELKELSDAFHKAMIKALGGAYPLVDKPGPDVLRFRAAIKNLTPTRAKSKELEIVRTRRLGPKLKRKLSGRHNYVGQASIEAELLDSQTNQRLAAVMDNKKTRKYEFYVAKWELVEDAFEFWANWLRHFLDEAHGK